MNKINISFKFSFLIMLIGFTQILSAQTISVGRYLSESLSPIHTEKHLLDQTFEVRFPETVTTIGQAMQYLLRFSGYSLVKTKTCELKMLMQKSLPEIDRHFGFMRLRNGLQTLAGEPYQLEVNPVERVINFQLKSSYRHYYHRHSC